MTWAHHCADGFTVDMDVEVFAVRRPLAKSVLLAIRVVKLGETDSMMDCTNRKLGLSAEQERMLHYEAQSYSVVIINWVQYLGPPVPFSFPDSRDLLEILRRTSSAERERDPREDPLGSGRIH